MFLVENPRNHFAICFSLLEEEEQVDICGKLTQLRKERMNLVSTQAQYRLVYDIIHRYICTSLKLRFITFNLVFFNQKLVWLMI